MKHTFLVAAAIALSPTPLIAQDAAVHVPAKDGTRIAVDVYLPDGAALDSDAHRVPALLELTRYWRGGESPSGERVDSLSELDRRCLAAGYALLKVDVRGTGASFGTRAVEYGRQEVRDGYDVVEWTVNQPWSSGAVGAYGTSYSGTTAEFLAATGHPAVKAVIPGWSDFDTYRSPARPYGLFVRFIETWGALVDGLDANTDGFVGASVARVDGDDDGKLLRAAVAEHAPNVDVAAAVRAGEFRDDGFGPGDDRYADVASLAWQREIEASGAAMLVLASWLDAGTAEGALLRLQHYTNPQNVVILASAHGGFSHASPFAVERRSIHPLPAVDEQIAMRIAFFDHHLKGVDNDVPDWPRLRYFNLGEEAFRTADAWPPPGVTSERLYFGADGLLASDEPAGADAHDVYAVDFGVSTGSFNRWWTQMGKPILRLHDREAMDARMLTYTTAPLAEDLQVTGTPMVTLRVRSSATDGAFFVYLEDVAPDGQSRYVSEGGLRALHRRPIVDPTVATGQPTHSFARADAEPLVPGELAEIAIQLWPTSVLFRKGHRIRIALAGADDGTFERFPVDGDVSWQVSRGAEAPSFLELPVVRPEGDG